MFYKASNIGIGIANLLLILWEDIRYESHVELRTYSNLSFVEDCFSAGDKKSVLQKN